MNCGIYKITNKITGKTYVGQSIHIEQRWKEHLQGKGSKQLHKDILELGIENFIFEILELCEKENLLEKEKFWVAFYNSYNDGYNENEGGDNSIQAILATRKEIHCYDLNGKYITSYVSVAEAERQTKVPNSNISKAARGDGRAKAGEYQWSYEKLECLPPYKRTCIIKNPRTVSNARKVKQFTLNGEFIAEYDSIKQASEQTNTNYSSLGMACNKKRKTAGGFIWRFSEEVSSGTLCNL